MAHVVITIHVDCGDDVVRVSANRSEEGWVGRLRAASQPVTKYLHEDPMCALAHAAILSARGVGLQMDDTIEIIRSDIDSTTLRPKE